MRRHHGVARALATVAAVILGVTACSSGSGEGAVAVAQARVTQKEAALSTAKAEATAVSTAFCTSSATYITALDRYGDVLTATAPTVNDVRTRAGPDPAPGGRRRKRRDGDEGPAGWPRPRRSSEATAALAAARAEARAADSDAAAGQDVQHDAPPPVSSATVNRVKQADAEFTANRRASPTTPRWRRRRSSSTPPRSRWRCRGCGCSPRPAA